MLVGGTIKRLESMPGEHHDTPDAGSNACPEEPMLQRNPRGLRSRRAETRTTTLTSNLNSSTQTVWKRVNTDFPEKCTPQHDKQKDSLYPHFTVNTTKKRKRAPDVRSGWTDQISGGTCANEDVVDNGFHVHPPITLVMDTFDNQWTSN